MGPRLILSKAQKSAGAHTPNPAGDAHGRQSTLQGLPSSILLEKWTIVLASLAFPHSFRTITFRLFKSKQTSGGAKLLRLTLHVLRGSNSEMPANLAGAHVPVFVSAANHEAAALKAVSSLTTQGFEFVDISDGKIHELDPNKWEAFIGEAWRDFATHFPKQAVVINQLDSGFLFIGPFASYESNKIV